MGKRLIIKGADFSSDSINSLVSSTQTDAGGWYDNVNGALLTSPAGINSCSKIPISGYSKISFGSSTDGLQPNDVLCWDSDDNYLGIVSKVSQAYGGVGGSVGSYIFPLKPNTAYFSYIYNSTYASLNMGLSVKIFAED